jgi:hypothetical protein
VTPHCPYIEFLPADLCDSVLRKELVADELKIVDGKIPLPHKPGLGIEVDMKALRKFEVSSKSPTHSPLKESAPAPTGAPAPGGGSNPDGSH